MVKLVKFILYILKNNMRKPRLTPEEIEAKKNVKLMKNHKWNSEFKKDVELLVPEWKIIVVNKDIQWGFINYIHNELMLFINKHSLSNDIKADMLMNISKIKIANKDNILDYKKNILDYFNKTGNWKFDVSLHLKRLEIPFYIWTLQKYTVDKVKSIVDYNKTESFMFSDSITTTYDVVAFLSRRVERLEESLINKRVENNKNIENNKLLVSENDSLKSKNNSFQKQLESKDNLIEVKDKKIKGLWNQNIEYKKEIEELKKINSELNEKLEKLNSYWTSNSKDHVDFQQTEKDNDFLKKENKELKKELFLKNKKIEELNNSDVNKSPNDKFIEEIEKNIDNESFENMLKYAWLKNLSFQTAEEIVWVIDSYLGYFKNETTGWMLSSTNDNAWRWGWSYSNIFIWPMLAKISEKQNQMNYYNYLFFLNNFSLNDIFLEIDNDLWTNAGRRLQNIKNLVNEFENRSLIKNLEFLWNGLLKLNSWEIDLTIISKKMIELSNLKDSNYERELRKIIKKSLKK